MGNKWTQGRERGGEEAYKSEVWVRGRLMRDWYNTSVVRMGDGGASLLLKPETEVWD